MRHKVILTVLALALQSVPPGGIESGPGPRPSASTGRHPSHFTSCLWNLLTYLTAVDVNDYFSLSSGLSTYERWYNFGIEAQGNAGSRRAGAVR